MYRKRGARQLRRQMWLKEQRQASDLKIERGLVQPVQGISIAASREASDDQQRPEQRCQAEAAPTAGAVAGSTEAQTIQAAIATRSGSRKSDLRREDLQGIAQI